MAVALTPESFVFIASQQGVVPVMQNTVRPFDSNHASCVAIYIVSNPYILNLDIKTQQIYLGLRWIYAMRISDTKLTLAGTRGMYNAQHR